MFAISLGCVNRGFNDAVSHTNAYNGECIPEASHENRMAHVPNPFKIKGKHNLSSCPLYASAGFNSCSNSTGDSTAVSSSSKDSMGFSSGSLGNTGK